MAIQINTQTIVSTHLPAGRFPIRICRAMWTSPRAMVISIFETLVAEDELTGSMNDVIKVLGRRGTQLLEELKPLAEAERVRRAAQAKARANKRRARANAHRVKVQQARVADAVSGFRYGRDPKRHAGQGLNRFRKHGKKGTKRGAKKKAA